MFHTQPLLVHKVNSISTWTKLDFLKQRNSTYALITVYQCISYCTNQEISKWTFISDLPQLSYITNKWMPVLWFLSICLIQFIVYFCSLFIKDYVIGESCERRAELTIGAYIFPCLFPYFLPYGVSSSSVHI